jgi:hypothetical protein
MSLLRWFTGKAPEAAEEDSQSSLPRDSTRPSPLAESRKSERSVRREKLYAVIRESMMNAGVLSSGYRFKVLSLDGRGRQFLVMIDLVGAPGRGTADLARIEASLSRAARVQHDIVVKAVYWREAAAAEAARAGVAPAAAVAPQAKPVAAAAAPVAPATPPGRFEPLKADEVAAFKQALATGQKRPAARSFDGAEVQGPQSYTLLTGFEDTELKTDQHPPALSPSQHGDLR